MDVYSYQCGKCFHYFTKLYSKDDNEQVYCSRCGSTEVITRQTRSFSSYIDNCLADRASSK